MAFLNTPFFPPFAGPRASRGGDRLRVSLHDVAPEVRTTPSDLDLLALDEALERLAELDPRKARLVELRFFGGMTSDDAAALLDIARSTAAEEWRLARAWLQRQLRPDRSELAP